MKRDITNFLGAKFGLGKGVCKCCDDRGEVLYKISQNGTVFEFCYQGFIKHFPKYGEESGITFIDSGLDQLLNFLINNEFNSDYFKGLSKDVYGTNEINGNSQDRFFEKLNELLSYTYEEEYEKFDSSSSCKVLPYNGELGPLSEEEKKEILELKKAEEKLLKEKREKELIKEMEIEISKIDEKVDIVLKDFEHLIGLDSLKHTIKEIAKAKLTQKILNNFNIVTNSKNFVILLTGNPGTGKTTVANILSKTFKKLKITDNSNFVNSKVSDVVGKYVGETSQKTKAVLSEARGGTFFLDEAYRLADGTYAASSGGDFGKESFETIMESIDSFENSVFIFAGYEDKMNMLYGLNEGFESRVTNHIVLKDYAPNEIVQIITQDLEAKNYDLSESRDFLFEYIEKKCNNKALEGNARKALSIANNIKNSHSLRIISGNLEKVDKILTEDIIKSDEDFISASDEENLNIIFNNALNELEDYVGLENVKKFAHDIGKIQKVNKKRKEAGLKVEKQTYHMAFTGSPGTGKTTVARIMGKILRGAGVLSSGHFVEITKDDLTGKKEATTDSVKKIIKKAKGGILFIDEAYSLLNDNQGKEAIDCLIREMEEYREDLVVIIAGYEFEIKKLLLANPGFASRVPNNLLFDDYKKDQLIKMTVSMIEKRDYILSEEAIKKLNDSIHEFFNLNMTKSNGRFIRNFVDKIISSQSSRIFDEDKYDELALINSTDIVNGSFDVKENFRSEEEIENEQELEKNSDLLKFIKEMKKDITENAV